MKTDWFNVCCPALTEEGSGELFIRRQALARHRTAEPRLCHFQAGGRDGRNQSRNRAAAAGSWKSADQQTTAGERHCCISLPSGWRTKQVLVLKSKCATRMANMCSPGRACEVAGSRKTRVVLVFHKAGWQKARFGEADKGEEYPTSSHAEIPDALGTGGFQHCWARTRFRNTTVGLWVSLPWRFEVWD